MRSVRASLKPILAAKCEKSEAMAKVAEVNTHAQARGNLERRVLQCHAVGCDLDPAQSGIVRKLAQLRQRIGHMRGPARAVRGAGTAAQILELLCQIAQRCLDLRQCVQKSIRQVRPRVASSAALQSESQSVEVPV